MQQLAKKADAIRVRLRIRARLHEKKEEESLPPSKRDLSRLAKRMHKSALQ